jgi:N-acetylmuramoyl-L-alanine amidase
MKKLKMILLDAGHGGIIDGCYVTPGKRSPQWSDGSQYFEGVGNRMIREELSKMLKAEGIRFKFVNEGNKDTSLRERVNYANSLARKYGVSETLLISIHSDAFSKPEAHGWSCFTTKGTTMSDTYAEELYKQMKLEFPDATFRTDKRDGDMDKEAQFYIIRKTVCPAILSENFFMTNEKECRDILMTKDGRRKIARAHLEMIKSFI